MLAVLSGCAGAGEPGALPRDPSRSQAAAAEAIDASRRTFRAQTAPQRAAVAPAAPTWATPAAWPKPPAKEVRARVDGQRLYSGRLIFSPVVSEVDRDAPLRYLESREGWVFVRTAEGLTGWLPPGAAVLRDAPAEGGRDGGVNYLIGPGFWQIEAPGAAIERVQLQRGEPGVAYLTLHGSLAGAATAAAPGPRGLAVLLEDARAPAAGLRGKTIVIDPGHGGFETGAVGYNGLAEKDSNLAVALRLRELLRARGARVVLTREGDHLAAPAEELNRWRSPGEKLRVDLEARSEIANSLPADVFVSIHGNGGPAGDAGTETYYTAVNFNGEQSRHLAGLLQAAAVRALGTQDRGVKNRGFNVLRYTEGPAALLETAFLSSPREADLLADPAARDALARALADAIEAFFRD